jgi:hypothetical protein
LPQLFAEYYALATNLNNPPAAPAATAIPASALAIDSVGEESLDLQLKLDKNIFILPPDEIGMA